MNYVIQLDPVFLEEHILWLILVTAGRWTPLTLLTLPQSWQWWKKMKYMWALVLCSLAGRDGVKGPGQCTLESSGDGEQYTLSRLQWVSSPFRLYTVCEPNAELLWCNQKYRVANLSQLIAIWRVDKVRPSILAYTDTSDCQENTVWLTESKWYFSHRESVVW